MRKKLLCILLTMAMIMTMLPMNALAAPEEPIPAEAKLQSEQEAEKKPSLSEDELQFEQSKQKEEVATVPSNALSLGDPKMEAGEGGKKIITADTTRVENGTYNIQGTFTNNHRLEVIGNVTIVLEDGCNATFNKGFSVPVGTYLTIEGKGSLTAKGQEDSAGIGGDRNHAAGNITINGGTVTATGGVFGAGIGGGDLGHGGNVTITGGTVTATGGDYGAGIGGGNSANGGIIDIQGGIVTAQGGRKAAGIGGGFEGNGGNVTITGGTVTANGREWGAGIGGGRYGSGGNVTISGGTVIAKGQDAACIGKGFKGNSMGSLRLLNMAAVDITKSEQQRLILDPTVQKLDGIRKVDIRPESAVIALEPQVQRQPLIYNGSAQSGYTDPGRNVVLGGTISSTDAGSHNFSAIPQQGCFWSDGTTQSKTYQWRIEPKSIGTQLRTPELQNISEGSGKFKAPNIRDTKIDEQITGTLTYTYNGRTMEKSAIEAELAERPAGSRGTISWTLVADGNFRGIVRGSIIFTIRGIKFTVDGVPADTTNAVVINNDLTYGKTWADIVTINSDRIIASVGDRTGTGRYFLNVSGRPGVGENEYTVLFTGYVGWRMYRNVPVLTGKVFIKKADYVNVTTEVSAELNAAAGSKVTVTLPTIPIGTGYGTPDKTEDTDPYILSPISRNRITVTSTGIPDNTGNMQFTVPVIPDTNHNGYNITVTLTPKAHVHNFAYVAVHNVMTAVCSVPGCPLTEDVRLTLTAPESFIYDGSAKEVTFAEGEAEAWKNVTGNDAPGITYTAEQGSTLTDGKPVNVGSYTASITVNRRWASLRFSIVPSRPEVTVEMSRQPLPLFPFIRVYQADINVDASGTQITKVEHSTTGLFYTKGDRITSPSLITHFFIRVTTADGKRYVYVYWNKNILPR